MAKILWKKPSIIHMLKTITVLCAVGFLLTLFTPNPEHCNCQNERESHNSMNGVQDHIIDPGGQVIDDVFKSRHKLAVVVSFRDRFEELLEFVPHLHKYLNDKNIAHNIYIINQLDNLRFNRASLANIGYLLSHTECDYIAIHDVDLLPLNPDLNYTYPKDGPFHVAAPNLHPKYHYDAFFGAILLINNNHFKLVNGMSNKYYGWGMEDDEFYVRILEMNLVVQRPSHIKTGRKTFRHIHIDKERPRDYKQYGQQKKVARERDRDTGVDNVDFELKYMNQIVINGAPATLVGIELNCDFDLTPWCMHPEQLAKYLEKGNQPVVSKQETEEEKRLEKIKESILKYQEEITEFRKNVKPVRKPRAEELPKWMRANGVP